MLFRSSIFAGRDASRGLAKQSFEMEMITPLSEPIDELNDLSASEWENLRDWECASSFRCGTGRVESSCGSVGCSTLWWQVHYVRVSHVLL